MHRGYERDPHGKRSACADGRTERQRPALLLLFAAVGTVIFIAVGGAVGALGRYAVVTASAGTWGASHYGTLLVNIVGSLLMGLIVEGISLGADVSEGVRLALVVGLLGAFTTFSAFSLDVFNLYDDGRLIAAAVYASASVALSVGALFAGIALARALAV